ncbi:hypothetical protein JCM19240_605 [Vibrio maritimus]|uniref:Uncharacterized protein n=1 Tax=Vibrio maritimus TaxID=990268 RepID=A0A090T918_9VIBR|nr:hypothetical protein JCM19240_605 [Vibrio maritimus]
MPVALGIEFHAQFAALFAYLVYCLGGAKSARAEEMLND